MLKDCIDGIRATYTKDFASKDLTKRQIVVATYLIDKLALRTGNEKDDDEADTVGCCTLKVENVTLVSPNKLQCYPGEDDLAIARAVLIFPERYLSLGNMKDANYLIDEIKKRKAFPESELTQFIVKCHGLPGEATYLKRNVF